MPLTKQLDLFPGEREVEHFTIPFHNGKGQLRCSIRERWTDCLVAFLRCGNTQKFRTKRVIGVSRRELTTLDEAVKLNLGLEGLVGLKGELLEHTTTEISMHESSEEEQEFQFQAPPKGFLAILVYQMQRMYYFEYEDTRWGRRNHGFRLNITEWLRRFFDDSKRHEHDPHCEEGIPLQSESDGQLLIDFKLFTVSVGYRQSHRGLEIPSLQAFVAAQNLSKIPSAPGTFERSMIPEYLLFLVGEDEDVMWGQFRVPTGEVFRLPEAALEEPIPVQRASALE